MKKIAILLALATTICIAEEKGMWQKFVDFFSPSPSVEGNSELEQNIQKLDKKIQSTRQDYNREHRPQRKTMLKREIEDLTKERDSLITVLENQKNIIDTIPSSSTDSSSSCSSSSSSISSSSVVSSIQPVAIQQPAEQCDTIWVIQKKVIHDTIYVRDTVIVHDTLFIEK